MELDDAIRHTEEIGHRMTMTCPNSPSCGLEHLQLAEWLKELKERRERDAASLSGRMRRKKWTFRVKWRPYGSYSRDSMECPSDPPKSEDFVTLAVQDCDAWNALIGHFHQRSDWFTVEYVSSEPV